ncbi:MAG: PQQ-binding-like beta-propeller repeat protein [Chloroflexi bacterium]|nr:PQQ-binding-like beta-propeller repeat protein [Chloroflexota bacterium]
MIEAHEPPLVGSPITRRRLLLLTTAAVGSGLLAATRGPRVVSAAEALQAALAESTPPAALAPRRTLAEQLAPHVTALPAQAEPLFGPLTDIAAGWDGTLWAIDAAGAPYQYDQAQQTWHFFGRPVDAVAAAPGAGTSRAFDGRQRLWMAPVLASGATAAPTSTATASRTPGRTATPTPTATNTPAHTTSPTATPLPTSTATSSATRTSSPTASPPATPTSTATVVDTTDTPTATATPAEAAAAPGGVLVFRGPEVALVSGAVATDAPDHASADAASVAPRLIADAWPHLPASFKLGVDGAATVDGVLYLFKAGRFVRADGARAPFILADLPNWPQAGPWNDGLADLALAVDGRHIGLVKGDQLVLVDPVAETAAPPVPLGTLFGGDLLARLRGGQLDAVLYAGPDKPATALAGAAAFQYAGPGAPRPSTTSYLPQAFSGWPAGWHPMLQHAPSGRLDALWAATRDGAVLHHDGTDWGQTTGRAASVAAGADGSVFAVGADTNQHQLLRLDGTDWTLVAEASAPLAQVAVGDTSRVWVRDSTNLVLRLDQSDTTHPRLTDEPLVGQATHIDANADGTVWSCGQDGNALRFISESSAPPQAIATGGVTKVASTSFGSAHFLVQQGGAVQVYQYDSPYVFKTSGTYQSGRDATSIAQGLGLVFLLDVDRAGPAFAIVALDAHTGEEVSVSASESGRIYTPPVFDPIQELVYVGVAPLDLADQTRGELRALNARDLGDVVWTYPTPAGIDAAPALSGGQLCFGDRSGTLHMLDTSGAGRPPTLRWQWQLYPASLDQGYRDAMPTPILANGYVYAVMWNAQLSGTGGAQANNLSVAIARCTALDGSNQVLAAVGAGDEGAAWELRSNQTPALGQARFDGASKAALFIPFNAHLWVFNVEDLTGYLSTLPVVNVYEAAAQIVSSPMFSSGANVWFGDRDGKLYGLDGDLNPVPHTPIAVGQGGGGASRGLLTRPVEYQGSILCAVADEEHAGRLVAFDRGAGTVLTIDTGQTAIASLSESVNNGVIYAAGTFTLGGPTRFLVPQALGIRVDQLVQDQRDFIIESQLMQDFDGPSTPDGVARYQTHLTIVDEHKAPRPREAVKIWADQQMTILVDGQRYTVGPADPEYAAVQTGFDGALVIVSGSVTSDASDKPDLFAPALRVWADFMDPHERILVQPDREFHNRLATAHATPGDDDPTRVNLQGAAAYGKKPLFSADQQKQGAPGQIAQAIQNMTSAVGVGTGGGTSAVAWVRRTTDTPGRYIAYDDLPGSSYSATNVRTMRSAAVVQPLGLHLSTGDKGDQPLTRGELSPAAAAAAIDALQGTDWKTSAYATQAAGLGGRRLGDAWGDFWGWIKQAVATVTDAIVSVGNDIMVGIRFIVDGVAHVFNQILHTLEDVVSAVGSFFKQLAIDIANAIEALSVFFNFDEIIKTHNILKQELLDRINGVSGNAAYPGFAAALANVKTPLDGFFKLGEKAISDTFNAVADQIAGEGQATGGQGVALTGLKGAGATAHTAFTVKPQGGGTPSSMAPQCTWGMQKFQSGLGASSGGQALAISPRAESGDPENFFKGFLERLTGDGDLNAQWAKLQAGAANLGGASSTGDFLREAVAELLRAVALLLDGALAVANAFLDGFLGLVGDVIARLFDPHEGLLTQPLDIPVLSWLYQKLFGEPLTILNAITLVAAIPVTFVWRLAKGQWPAQSLGTGTTATGRLGAFPALIELMGILGGVGSILNGILTSVADGSSLFTSGWQSGSINALKANLASAVLMVSLGTAAVSFPLLASTSPPSASDWTSWGVALAIAPASLLGVPGLFFAFNDISEQTKLILPKIVPWITSILNLVLLGVALVAYLQARHPSVADDVAFGYTVAATVPGIFNPVTLFGVSGELIIAAVDLFMGVAVGVLIILKATGVLGASALAGPGPSAAAVES